MSRDRRRTRAKVAPDASRPERARQFSPDGAHGGGATGRRSWLIPGGVFLLALIWRLAYLGRLADAALLASLPADERVYWDWATYLMSHGFQGSNPFFFGPLYPYVLALVRTVVGSDVGRVLIVQAVWGAAGAALITDAARRLAGWPVAAAAGVLYALYEMNVFFDGLVLMESLLLFLEALLLWLWTRSAQRTPGAWALAAIGAVTGLVALGRATSVLLLVPLWWIARPREGERPRHGAVRLAIVAAAFVVTVSPAAVHNWRVAREWIPFSYNFGINLYIGNHENATGRFLWVAGPQHVDAVQGLRPDGGIESDGRLVLEREEGRAVSARESSDLWARKAWRWMRDHPLDVLRLAGSKLVLAWNAREQHQIESADMYRRRAGPLGLPLAGSFVVLGILGLVGAVHLRAHPRIGPALLAYVTILTASMLPFFVTDRYRAHLVPALALLAVIAVDAWRRRPRKPGTALRFAAPAALAAGLVLVPISSPSDRLQVMLEGFDMGTRWLDQGRPDLAAHEYAQAVQLEAAIPGIERQIDADVRGARNFNYAYALRATGRPEEALRWFGRAAEVAPQNPRFVRTLGDAYRAAGRAREGDSLLATLEGLTGSGSERLVSRGYDAARDGRHAEAESLFAAAVNASMRDYAAWGALVRIQVQQRALGRARTTVEQLRQTGAPPHFILLYDAFVLAASGEAGRAKAMLADLPPPEAGEDPILGWVRSTTEKMIAAGGG